MKRMVFVIAIAMVSLCSCGEMIRQERAVYEKFIVDSEREKVPFWVQKYRNIGVDVVSITVDTVSMMYEPNRYKPYWGYINTTWTVRENSGDNYDLFPETILDRKTVLVEIYDIKNGEGCGRFLCYTAKWPEVNPFEDKIVTKNN